VQYGFNWKQILDIYENNAIYGGMSDMNKKFIIIFSALWIFYKIFEYYFVPSFIWPLFWIGISCIILFSIIVQISELMKNRKNVKIIRIINLIVLVIILFFNIEDRFISRIIEKVDWIILFKLRNDTVEKVIGNELNPNVEWNNISCKLPFKFPIISDGENAINIHRYDDKTLMVEFYADRTFFENKQTEIVYTNNNKMINNIEEYILNNSKNNWKLKENWYRLYVYNIFEDKIE
jgi:hypothetical protein